MIIETFAIPIYSAYFNREFTLGEKQVFEKVYQENRPNHLNITGIDECILNDRRLTEIKSFIQVHLNQYTFNAFGRDSKSFVEITTSWLNLTKPGQAHHNHSHPNSIYSGVFYFKSLPQDNLIITRPYPNLTPFSYGKNPRYMSDEKKISVKKGDLLIFPSTMHHRVDENKSNDDRISLAFNTIVKGEIGYDISKLYID